MAVGNSINDEIREQRHKLKGKSAKEKWLYFWEYYRFPTLIGIVVAAIVINIAYSIITAKTDILTVDFVNCYTPTDYDTETMGLDFMDFAGIDPKENNVILETNVYIDFEGDETEFSVANVQKITALVSAGSLDAFLSDDFFIDYAKDAGTFADLSETLPPELLERYRDRLYYTDVEDDEKGEIPIGIDVRDCNFLLSNELPAYFCMTSNTQHPDEAICFLTFLMDRYLIGQDG